MPEILFTPMIFRARILTGRRRTEEDAYLRKTVPVEIETVSGDDAPMVADLGHSGHLRDMGGSLLVPLSLCGHRRDSDDVSIDALKSIQDDRDVSDSSQGRSGAGEFKHYGIPNAVYVSLGRDDVVLPFDDPSIRNDVSDYERRAFSRLVEGYAALVAVDGRIYRRKENVVPMLTVSAGSSGDAGLTCGIEAAHDGKISSHDDRVGKKLVFSLFDKHHFGSAFDDQFGWGGWDGMDAVGGLASAERFFVETLPTNMKVVRKIFEDLFAYVKAIECPLDVLSIVHEYRNEHAPLWDSVEERDMLEVLAAVAVHSDALASVLRREDRYGEERDDEKVRSARQTARMARMVMASVFPHQAHLRRISTASAAPDDARDESAFSFGI